MPENSLNGDRPATGIRPGSAGLFCLRVCPGPHPQPCVRCNAAIKFGRLWEYLQGEGFTHLATGHYARVHPADDGAPGLFRGVDRRKDQSYFLSRLPLNLLPNLLFPLGQMTKEEVRRLSRQAELPIREDQPESMELCFIPAGSYQDFLKTRRGFSGPPGDFVDPGGASWAGTAAWKAIPWAAPGLGIPAREPFYVIDLQPELNRVVLGHREELLSPGLTASRLNWLIPLPAGEIEALAVIRYRHPGVRARITPRGDGEVQVAFAIPSPRWPRARPWPSTTATASWEAAGSRPG